MPNPARRYDYLDDVACTSRSSCWAVGYYGNKVGATLNEALRWNGRRWRRVRTPQPAGLKRRADRSQLNGVACISASNCWAVGEYTNRHGASLSEALHWNGRKWTRIATPNPAGTGRGHENVAYSVSCTSRSNCVLVGYGRTGAGTYVNEAQHWNGKAWGTLPTPQPGGATAHGYSYLADVDCSSRSGCWAVGGYSRAGRVYANQAMRWNGKNWTEVSTPRPGRKWGGNELTSVSCVSQSDCWAVGYYYGHKRTLNEALRWNGKTWSQAATPQPGRHVRTHTLLGVSCASASQCWAVGYVFNTGSALNQAMRWNGKKWSLR